MRVRTLVGLRLRAAGTALALTAAVALTACGGSGGNSATTTSRSLVVDTSFILKTLDPARLYENTGYMIVGSMYDTLTKYRDGNAKKVYPDLAQSYSTSSDQRTFTFNLRRDARFTDGTPVTAADVVFSFRRLQNIGGSASYLLLGSKVTTEGRYTVKIAGSAPNPAIPFIVAAPELGVLNSKLVERNGGTDGPDAARTDRAESFLDRTSAGSGPFVLGSFSLTSQVVLKANHAYWGERPHVDSVTIRNTPVSTQALNVQRDESQIALDVAGPGLEGLDRSVRFVSADPILVAYLAMNQGAAHPTTSNPHIVAAVRAAIDYQRLRELAGAGAKPVGSIIPSGISEALPPGDLPAFDIAKARQEVTASGIAHPQVSIEYPSDYPVNGGEFGPLAQRIQADLESAGIHVKLMPAPTLTALQRFRDGKADIAFWTYGPDYPDPSSWLIPFQPGGLFSVPRIQWTAKDAPALAQLSGRTAAAGDASERTQLYAQWQRAMNDAAPYVPLFGIGVSAVASSSVETVELSPATLIDLATVRLR